MRGIAQDDEHGPEPGKGLFRTDALKHRAEAQGPGGVAKIAPRWTTWAFYGLVALVAALVVVASIVRIDRYASGIPATGEGNRVVALIAAAVASEIAPGSPVELGETRAEVVSSTGVLDPSEVRRRYDVEVAVPSVAVVTTARVFQAELGSIRVLVESDPVIVALIPGLKTIFGGDDA